MRVVQVLHGGRFLKCCDVGVTIYQVVDGGWGGGCLGLVDTPKAKQGIHFPARLWSRLIPTFIKIM